MKFSNTLVFGTLIKRYKRFLADVLLDSGEVVTAHCANPGAMLGLAIPDSRVALEPSDNPARKLRYSWRLIKENQNKTWVGIDTSLPNKIIHEALENRHIKEVAMYETIRPEVKYHDNSRIDFLLTSKGLPDCYMEVKNVHMCRTAGIAAFPDSVTARGSKHLDALGDMVLNYGHRAIMLYCIQRTDCTQFTLAPDIDPVYVQSFNRARTNGVEVLSYTCAIDTQGIEIAHSIPIIESPLYE